VVFRLSQEEYGSLLDACTRAGARNVSDFTRSEVLQCLDAEEGSSPLARRFALLEQRIAVMQIQLNDLFQGVFHEEVKQQQPTRG
jgi:hypothetical protein